MHLAFTWSSVVYFAVCIISRNGGAAVTYDVQLDCPPEFVDATPSLVNATVSTTKFPLCTDDQVTKVIFTVTPTVGVSQRICEQPYPGCNTTTNSNGCRCVNNTGSTYIYELSFVFDKQTQTGSTLDLKPTPCFSFSNPYPFLHSPCRNLTGKATTPTTAATTSKDSTPPTLPLPRCTCCRCPVLILLVLLLPFPGPWPGYLIYVLICWIIYKRHRSTGSGCWHTHYLCGKKTCCVYFSACIVTNNGGAVLIWSKSPATGRFVCYGTEKTLDTSRNNVSAEIGAVDNGNKHSSQKEKNKHTGTDGSKDIS